MSVNFTEPDDSTGLRVSTAYDNLESTKLLVARGAALNSTNVYGNTLLMEDPYKGKTEFFRYLRKKWL